MLIFLGLTGETALHFDDVAGRLVITKPDGSTVNIGGEAVQGADEAFPVGSIYTAVVPTNPSALLGYGVWTAFGPGRTLVGINPADPDFDQPEKLSGAKTHTLSTAEMPAHTHIITSQTATTGGATSYEHGTLDTSSAEAEATEVTGSTGGGGAHNNVQPSIAVYLWKRVA